MLGEATSTGTKGGNGCVRARVAPAALRRPPPPPIAHAAIRGTEEHELTQLRDELLSLCARCREAGPPSGGDDDDVAALASRVHDCFDRLRDFRITRTLLERTGGAKVVHKFATKLDADRFPSVTRRAKALRLRMMARIGATGRRGATLGVYRARVRELKHARRCKPDMIAYSELRTQPAHRYARTLGHLEDVPVGMTVEGRGEAAILGIHTAILSGIDANKDAPCFAVCIAGQYDDDESQADALDGDGTIYYTGSGGRNEVGQQEHDQTENVANQSLILSNRTGDPIRVLRLVGEKGMLYRYDGLYQCTGYNYEPSLDGPMVYKFTLKPLLKGQSMFSIMKDLRRNQGE